jgi:hypothetical protein
MTLFLATHYGVDALLIFIGWPALAVLCGTLSAIFAFRKKKNFGLCVLGGLFSLGTGAVFVSSAGGDFTGPLEFSLIWLPVAAGIAALVALCVRRFVYRRKE